MNRFDEFLMIVGGSALVALFVWAILAGLEGGWNKLFPKPGMRKQKPRC